MKSRRAVAKRFKSTATGKLKYKKMNLRHILTKKSSDDKRGYRRPGYLAESDVPRIRRAMAI